MLRSVQLFLLVMLCAFFSEAQITSTFDVDADGWTFYNGSTGASLPPTFSATGGNPSGGHIFLTYNSSVSVSSQNWIAPSKFLGNQVIRSLGMDLTFDLQQSIASTSSGTTTGSVRIESGGNALVYSFTIAERPGTSWRSYTLKLDETGGWLWNSTTGVAATRAQVISVLTNITSLEIRASYAANGSYTARLDNVALGQKALGASPTISTFTPKFGTPGTSVTITGTNFDAAPGNNTVYFSGREATINSASPTQITVTVPQAASYGPITVINKTVGLLCQSLTPFNPTFNDGGRIIPSSLAAKSDIVLTGVTNLYGIASADIDGDGWMDIIVSENTGTTSVLRNLGTGGDISSSSFAPKFSLTGSNATIGVWVEDLDGDGKHDVVSAYSNGSQMSYATFRNISTPNNIAFESAELWPALAYSGMLSDVVDVDGDGRLDLVGQHRNGSVTTDFWITQNISSPGQIEFAATTSYFGSSTLDAGDGVGHGDLDNDGKPEMLVVHSFGGQFQILKNTSTPTAISFGTPFVIPEGVNGRPIVADFNLDGLNDIAFKQGFSNDDIRIRINTNSGGLLSAADFATEIIINTADFSNYGGVSIADINGDGKPDLLATDAGNIAVFENVYSGGAFTSAAFVPGYIHQGAGNSTYPTTPVASDLNGDGKLDLIMGVTNTTPNRVSIFQNRNVHTPMISLTTVSPLKGPVGSTVTITGDYFSTTPDENTVTFGGVAAEVVAATRNQLTVLVPAGAAYGPVSVTRDELTARYHLPFNVLFSPGTTLGASSFGSPINFTLPTADFDIDAADLDGDNKIDIVAEGASQQSYFLKNTFSSGAISTASLTTAGNTTSGAANPRLVDLNGDGKPEIASVQGIFRNTSTASAIAFDAVTNVAGATNIGFADFNLDGRMDVVGVNGTVVEVNENTTRPGAFVTGTFGSMSNAFNLASGGTAVGSAVADFDNDGLTDIAATVSTTLDNIVIFKNNGGYRISVAQFSNAGTFASLDLPGRIYEGDLDVDGKIDLVVYNQAASTNGSNYISVFHNTSTSGSISFSRVDYQIGTLTGTTGTIGGPSTIADLDGDGRPEIIVTSASTNAGRQGFYIYKNNTTPGTIDASSFTSSGLIALTGARAVAAADLNLDHRPELIFTRTGSILSVMENLVTPTTLTFTTQPATATLCDVMDADLNVAATGDNNLMYRWQKLNTVTGKFEDVPDDATYEGVNSQTLEISYPPLQDTYRAIVQGDYSLTTSASAVLTVATTPTAPGVSGDTECQNATATLTATGGPVGGYQWYTSASGNSAIAGEINSTYTTPPLSATTSFFVSRNNSGCESTREEVVATINVVSPPTTVAGERCDAGPVNVSASGGTNGQYRWYDAASAGNLFPGEVNSAFTTPVIASSTSYFVSINNGICESVRTQVIATVNSTPPAPSAMNSSRCNAGTVTLNASGASAGDYRWYTTLTGGSPLSGETGASYTSPSLSSTTSYFVSQRVNNCESSRTEAIASVTIIGSPTATTSAARCGQGTLTVSASGGTNGNYRWYDVAMGGSAITGEVNSSFTTPSLSASTTYHVALSDGTCESSRVPVVAAVNIPPVKPIIISSSPSAGNVITVCNGNLTLSAPAGFSYLWSTGATSQQLSVSASGSYSVQVTDGNNCTSVSSDAIQVIFDATQCNTPPVINPENLVAQIEGSVTFDLSTIISDADNNIDISSVTIETQPTSGATATISNGQLELNYAGVSFSGTDIIRIRVCDLAGSCATENLTIEVIGDIEVFNALSPNGDGLNEFLRIQYIEVLDRTRNNKVTILNRWGDRVFEISNYDNNTKVFKGLNNNGVELPSGTYFYKIEFAGQDAPPMKTGYLTLKR